MLSEILNAVGSAVKKGAEWVGDKTYEYSKTGLPFSETAKNISESVTRPFVVSSRDAMKSSTKLGEAYDPIKIGNMADIFSDHKISDDEAKKITGFGQEYVNIAKKARGVSDIANMIYGSDFEKFDEPTKIAYINKLNNQYKDYKSDKDKFVSRFGEKPIELEDKRLGYVNQGFKVVDDKFEDLWKLDSSPNKSLSTGLRNYYEKVKERQLNITPKDDGTASKDTMGIVNDTMNMSVDLMNTLIDRAEKYSKKNPGATFEDFLQKDVQNDRTFNQKFNDLTAYRKGELRKNIAIDSFKKGDIVMGGLESLGYLSGLFSQAFQGATEAGQYALGGSSLGGLSESGNYEEMEYGLLEKLYRQTVARFSAGGGDVIAALVGDKGLSKIGSLAKIDDVLMGVGNVGKFLNTTRTGKVLSAAGKFGANTVKESVIGTAVANPYTNPYITPADFAQNLIFDAGFNSIIDAGRAIQNLRKINLVPLDKLNSSFVEGVRAKYPELDPEAVAKIVMGNNGGVLNLVGEHSKAMTSKVINTLNAGLDYLDTMLGKEGTEGVIEQTAKKIDTTQGAKVSKEVRSEVMTYLDEVRKNIGLSDAVANDYKSKIQMGSKEDISNILSQLRKGYETAQAKTISYVESTIQQLRNEADETGLVDYNELDSVLSRFGQTIKGNLKSFVESGGVAIDDGVQKIISKFNDTGKLSDSDVMNLASSYMKGLSTKETDANKLARNIASYFGQLGYVVGDDAIQGLAGRIRSAADILSKVGVKIKLTGKNESYIKDNLIRLSYLSDYYDGNPEKFAIALIHEMTHGLDSIIKKVDGPLSEQVIGLQKLYSQQSEKMRKVMSQYVYGKDTKRSIGTLINDMAKGIGKFGEIGPDGLPMSNVEKPGYVALRNLAHRYANFDEFLTYNLSEYFLGKDVDDAISDIGKVVKGLGDEFGKGNKEYFESAAQQIQDAKYKSDAIGLKQVKNIMSVKSNAVKIVNDFVKAFSKGAGNSMATVLKLFKAVDTDEGLEILRRVDDNTAKEYEAILSGPFSTSMKQAIKENIAIAMGMGFRGKDATIGASLYSIFNESAGAIFSKFGDVKNAVQLEDYFKTGQTKLDTFKGLMRDYVSNFAPKGKNGRIVRDMFDELYILAHYYSTKERYETALAKGFDELAIQYKTQLDSFLNTNVKSGRISYKAVIDRTNETKTAKGIITAGSSFLEGDVDIAKEFFRSLGQNSVKEGKAAGLMLFKKVADKIGLKKSIDTAEDIIAKFSDATLGYGKTSSGGTLNNVFATFGTHIDYTEDAIEVITNSIKSKGIKATIDDIGKGLIAGAKVMENMKPSVRKLFASVDTGDVLDSFYAMGGGKKNYRLFTDLIYSNFEYNVAKEILDQVSISQMKGVGDFAKAVVDSDIIYKRIYNDSNKTLSVLSKYSISPRKVLKGELNGIAAPDISVSMNGGGKYKIIGDDQTLYYVDPDSETIEGISYKAMNAQEYRKQQGLEGFKFNDDVVYDLNNTELFSTFGLNVRGYGTGKGMSKKEAVIEIRKMMDNTLLDINRCK